MNTIAYEPFMKFCKTGVDQVLPTIGGEAEFKLILVQGECLRWTVLSTKKEHYSKKKWIQKYLNYYNQTNSLRSTDYNKNIHCTEASNILALINLYVDSNK